MPIDIAIKPAFPRIRGGRSPSADFEWLIYGAPSLADAIAELVSALPPTYYTGVDILTLQEWEVVPQLFGPADGSRDVFFAQAKYSNDDGESGGGGGAGGGDGQDPGDPAIIQWDTGGGTTHVTQALAQRDYDRYSSPSPKPDPVTGGNLGLHAGAIGVTEDGVEGVDIVVPAASWSEQYTFNIEDGYGFSYFKDVVSPMTGKINGEAFRGFEAFDVLFLGATGQNKGYQQITITYKFTHTPTKTNLPIGDKITVDIKYGHDYIWTRYKTFDDPVEKRSVKVPLTAHVAKVYEVGDFSELLIGV